MLAKEVCPSCPGLEHCKFSSGERPVVKDEYGLWNSMGAVFISRESCPHAVHKRRLESVEAQWDNSGVPTGFRGCRLGGLERVGGTGQAMWCSGHHAGV